MKSPWGIQIERTKSEGDLVRDINLIADTLVLIELSQENYEEL